MATRIFVAMQIRPVPTGPIVGTPIALLPTMPNMMTVAAARTRILAATSATRYYDGSTESKPASLTEVRVMINKRGAKIVDFGETIVVQPDPRCGDRYVVR